jgi:3-deoxy-manno-octulosonate cytidylyltransferase (CMP-KDO synthetase)
MTAAQILGVIPARHASTRFPGKPLALLHGRPMIEWVHRQATQSRLLGRVVVATDDERIARAVEAFGGEAVMTSASHATGTDRVAEVARLLGGEILVNVQGDEPLVEPETIDACVEALLGDDGAAMGTLATPLASEEEYEDRSVVKVVLDARMRALYFSRAPVPCARSPLAGLPPGGLRHLGLYSFRRAFLDEFHALPPSRLEAIEGLEQLRALENGVRVAVRVVATRSLAVDRPEDVPAVEARLRELHP